MNNFDFVSYIPLALRTEAPLPSAKLRLEHAALGLVTEIGEFTTDIKRIDIYGKQLDDAAKPVGTLRTHIAEEIGDALWYLAIAASALDFVPQVVAVRFPYEIPEGKDLRTCAFVAAGAAGKFAEVLLENERDTVGLLQGEKLRAEVIRILAALAALASLIDIPLQTIADENIAKLAARYPDKFSAKAAEARADKGGEDAHNS